MDAHVLGFFFFFKQKTAYEIVSRDWSSDVCSSDLGPTRRPCSPPRSAPSGSRSSTRRTAERTAQTQPRTVLITGADGFAGSHLARLLAADGHALHVTVRGAKPQGGAALPERLTCHSVDLRERSTVEALVQSLRPDWVFHLAASSSVAASWEDPAETLINNIGAQANLLAALVGLERLPRVLVVGSADEYGAPQRDDALLDEDAPLRPITPYGVSKVAQDYLALQYHLSHGLPVVRVRPFNHVGPGQSPAFAVASFARQVARIEVGR